MLSQSPDRVAIPLTLSMPMMRQTQGQIHQIAGLTMGTTWSVKFVGAATEVGALREFVEAALHSVIAQMSPWEATSELSRFNSSAPATWQTISGEFAKVIGCALRIAEQTDGAFDPTLGASVDLWGFGPAPHPSDRPATEAVDRARLVSGWRQLEFDPANRRLRRLSGARLDLNGIAKGFAVDLVASSLSRAGIYHALVEIGGELSGAGVKPDGTPWWVRIDHPVVGSPSKAMPLIALHELAIATSGIERSFFTGKHQFSHTINPRSGFPIDNGMIAASVMHASCMEADAYATALMVMGPEAGIALADKHSLPTFCLFRPDGGHDIVELISAELEAMLS